MKLNRATFRQILDKYYELSPQSVQYVLAVDFDNTLCYTRFPACGEPTAVAKFIKSIQDLNVCIILTTCREGQSLTTALDWCAEQGIRLDYVNENEPSRIEMYQDCRKIFCNMLIDDTSYNFNIKDFK